MNLFNVVSVEDSVKLVCDNSEIKLLGESVELNEALGRIIKDDIISAVNVPDFRRSTVDGYAVSSRGVRGASESIPAMMNLKGEVAMGQCPTESIDSVDECVYVPTGGMLPQGADSVVMIEYTEKLDESILLISSPVAPGDNVIEVGEDISEGETIIKAGTQLRPYEIGVLSSLGIRSINVFRKPKIAVISTGDEVVNIDEISSPGKIRDINSYLLNSLIIESGGEPYIYGVVKDSYTQLKDMLIKALRECDIILVSGGSSVGKKDETLKVLEDIGQSKVFVHGISIKPGKPTIIGKALKKIVFGLPGHPLACAVVFKAVVEKYMEKLMDYTEIEFTTTVEFSINYHKAKGREEYLPVILKRENEKVVASPVLGKSGLMSVFSRAWGFVRIDKNIEGLREGQMVEVYRF